MDRHPRTPRSNPAGPIAIALACAALLGPQALAQSGSLRVRVLDGTDREPVAAATVILSSEKRYVAPATERTGPEGIVVFPVLRAGTGYVLEILSTEFARQRIADLEILLGETTDLTVLLLERQQETVEVSARRGVVELDSTGSSSKFSDRFVQDLPVLGRQYQNVLRLAPGVLDQDRDGNPNVHGSRSRDFQARVSGVSNVDPLTGQWLSRVNPDSIEELEVITSGAGVEFGRAQGGFARVLQRQGSNEYEALVNFLWRSSKLDRDGAGGVPSTDVPEFDLFQPAVQFTGPILRDRVWFRLSHEYVDAETPVNVLNAIEVRRERQALHSDQITWQVTPRNKLAFQMQSDPRDVENEDMDSRTRPSASRRIERGGSVYGVTWTAAWSPRLLVETLAAYQDIDQSFLPQQPNARNSCLLSVTFPALEKARCLDVWDGVISGPHPDTWRDKRQRLTVRSQATYYAGRFLGGDHQLKFGLSIENERYFRKLTRGPDLTFARLLTLGGIIGWADTRFAVPPTSEARATGGNWGVFVEDRYKPFPNLTVTLGARVDREAADARSFESFDPREEAARFLALVREGTQAGREIARSTFTAYEGTAAFVPGLAEVLEVPPREIQDALSASAGQTSFWKNQRQPEDFRMRNTLFSPRLTVAWDPAGNGRSRLAATAGRFYGSVPLAVPLVPLEPADVDIRFPAFKVTSGGQPIWVTWFFNRGLNPAFNVRVVDPDLRVPYQDEWTAGFEHEIAPETALRITYVHRTFEDQLQDIDINHLTQDYGKCVETLAPFVPVVDISEGPDGLLDDCAGTTVQLSQGPVQRPDGQLDLYLQNPGWGDIYELGNFNRAEYESWVLEIVRRSFRNWELQGSYTWSEAIGDAEDFDQVLGNDRSLLREEYGYLAYDQRHVVKLNATTVTPWGVRLGGSVSWESGLPYSKLSFLESRDILPPGMEVFGTVGSRLRQTYTTGKRNDQRNPSYWNVDLRVAKEMRVGRSGVLQLTAEVFNALNDDTIRIDEVVEGQIAATRRFGRQYQLGFRLTF